MPMLEISDLHVAYGAIKAIHGVSLSIEPGEIPALCERVRALLGRSGAGSIVCDVAAVTDPDACTVDALARLQLAARRHGCHVRLHNASPALLDLVELMGLTDVLGEERFPRAGDV